MSANTTVQNAIDEFRSHMGNAALTLRQKRAAMKGLMHISLQRLTELHPLTELRLHAVVYEWAYMRAPEEAGYSVECLGRGLLTAVAHGRK